MLTVFFFFVVALLSFDLLVICGWTTISNFSMYRTFNIQNFRYIEPSTYSTFSTPNFRYDPVCRIERVVLLAIIRWLPRICYPDPARNASTSIDYPNRINFIFPSSIPSLRFK